jgi:hypothetical protein
VNPNDWSQRLKQFNAGLDADQVEIKAMLTGLAHVDAGMEDEKMAGTVDDALIESGNSWAERQVILETLSGAIAEEVDRRAALMKDAYPFQITKAGALSYRKSKTGVYELCLVAARNPTGAIDGKPKASAVFEFIARDVVAAHLGKGSRGFRAGAPSYEFEKRGNCTRETFLALEKLCGEFHWNPETGFPTEPSYQDLKDAGLDIVVWKPWSDGRLGHLFLIGQCACGKNDIEAKARELEFGKLGMWLRPVCHAQPAKCFLLAHHIPNIKHLHEISKAGGVVLDRARIAITAESAADDLKSPEGIDYHKMANIYATAPTAE